MQVLVVTNMYPTARNPVLGIFVKQQVDSLRARGVDVDVLFVDGPASKLNYLVGIPRLARQLCAKRYDLIHAHYHFSGYVARAQLSVPIVLTHHGPEVVAGWEKPLTKLITPLVDAVIAVSPEVKTILRDPRIRVIPCGVDLELFAPADQLASRRALGLPEDRPLVLWPHARNRRKRLDRAEKAVELLRQRIPEAELVVASGLPPERVPIYMNACDAFLLTSESEGSPQTVKEAMACNLPVVAVDVGDVADLIRGTDGCYLASPAPPDLARQLEAALRRQQRTNGREAMRAYSLPAIADRIIEVYGDTLRAKLARRVVSAV
jgi:glycosyltransferase involved in cell wall biosynthesis